MICLQHVVLVVVLKLYFDYMLEIWKMFSECTSVFERHLSDISLDVYFFAFEFSRLYESPGREPG